jgi:hypothetical protein
MKAIFAALNLDDGNDSHPANSEKRKASVVDASLAANQEPFVAQSHASAHGDAYGLGFDDGRGFWGDQQGGGAYGIQKP